MIPPQSIKNEKIKFELNNANGESLAGLLEMPEHNGGITGFGLFAHCFTCAKDIVTASRIARAGGTRYRSLENDPQIVTELIGGNG